MDYEYWRTALARPDLLQAKQLKITSDPCLGFYRDRFGVPIAIWYDPDAGLCMDRDGQEVAPKNFAEVWLSGAMRPVPEEWYLRKLDGQPWPDVDEAVAGMGDNIRSGMDPIEQIDLLNDEVRRYGQIEDDETAKRAISLRARIMELKGSVDKKREELKAPHLKAAREVDDIYMPPVKKALSAANALKALVEAWETRKRRLAMEAEQAAERARLEAEQAERPPPEPAPAPVAEPMTQIRSGYGRAASVRERLVVTEITNLGDAFASVGMRQAVRDAMIAEAQKAVDAGAASVPGFAVEQRAVIR